MGALDSWFYEASVRLALSKVRHQGNKEKTEKQEHPVPSQSPLLPLRSVSSVLT